MDKEKITEYGYEVASTWGAELISWKMVVGHDENGVAKMMVRYNCVEHGEYFYTDVDLKEIK